MTGEEVTAVGKAVYGGLISQCMIVRIGVFVIIIGQVGEAEVRNGYFLCFVCPIVSAGDRFKSVPFSL